jgi:anti-sigma regulatory factor (Ser/Thr protein kinase)
MNEASDEPQSSMARTGVTHLLFDYEGESAYLAGVLPYFRAARTARATLVLAVSAAHREQISPHLPGQTADEVVFVPAGAWGSNPGRFIPAWRDWITAQPAHRPVFAVNELDWSGHSAAARCELRYQEWLLNQAFADAPAFSLLCPVDRGTAPAGAVQKLARSHPHTWIGSAQQPGSAFQKEHYVLEDTTAEPDTEVEQMRYGVDDLSALRALVAQRALAWGVDPARITDLQLAVTEIATNSIRYGDGHGTLRIWHTDEEVVCELSDAGVIADRLAGIVRPPVEQLDGRGLWFVNQVCDLVQIRSAPGKGTRIRLSMSIRAL